MTARASKKARDRALDNVAKLLQWALNPPDIDWMAVLREELSIAMPDWRFEFAEQDRWEDDGGPCISTDIA